jgi:Ribonuclease G/E
VFSTESVTARIDRDLQRGKHPSREFNLSVHPAVSAYLNQNGRQIKKMLEEEHRCRLFVIEDEELDQDEYTIKPHGRNQKE